MGAGFPSPEQHRRKRQMARFGATLFAAAAIVTLLARRPTQSARGAGFALLLADLDQLKTINDRFGHQAGDEAICEVANVLRSTLRASDIPARIGGDDFAVLLPGTGAAGAGLVGERLSRALSENGPVARTLGLSYGVAVPTADCHELDDVMRAADNALYDAKIANGKGAARGRRPLSAPAAV